MTTFSFFIIFFTITFCVGIVILVIGGEIESEPQNILGTLVMIISIISLVITIVEYSQTLVSNHVWLLYIIPVLFLFISLFEFIDSKGALPWNRDYYKEYRSVTKEYCDLRDKFNSLEKQLNKEKKSHEKEIQKILKHKPLEVKQSNIKLHL